MKAANTGLNMQFFFLVHGRLFSTGARDKKQQNKNKEKGLNVSVLRLLFSSLQRLFEQSECSGISQVRFPEITPRAVCADVLFANVFPLSTMPASCLQVVPPPAHSAAPRAACVHVRTRGPNLGTYSTIVCSFPAACHDGRRGTFSFFRKRFFFFWHTINHSTDTQQNCPCDAMRHAWVCDSQRGCFSRRLLFFFPPFPTHHNYSLSVLLYLHSDPSFTFKRP